MPERLRQHPLALPRDAGSARDARELHEVEPHQLLGHDVCRHPPHPPRMEPRTAVQVAALQEAAARPWNLGASKSGARQGCVEASHRQVARVDGQTGPARDQHRRLLHRRPRGPASGRGGGGAHRQDSAQPPQGGPRPFPARPANVSGVRKCERTLVVSQKRIICGTKNRPNAVGARVSRRAHARVWVFVLLVGGEGISVHNGRANGAPVLCEPEPVQVLVAQYLERLRRAVATSPAHANVNAEHAPSARAVHPLLLTLYRVPDHHAFPFHRLERLFQDAALALLALGHGVVARPHDRVGAADRPRRPVHAARGGGLLVRGRVGGRRRPRHPR
mmetsp:Transcript_22990/g.74916  ORF Transcript_22990/g.74916 Transcript_22990/m.74916 type:complete len:333 (+) Transcript_22990:730-1728(+)